MICPNAAQLEVKPMKLAKKLVYILTATVLLVSLFVLPAAAATNKATPTQSAVLINGVEKKFEAYCINGNNYFKLRDIAYALSGTSKQFQTTFNEVKKQVDLTSQTAYSVVGGEMALSGATNDAVAAPAPFDVCLDGVKLTLTAYLIGSSNYVKLRDIAAAVDFGVKYVAERNSIEIDTTTGYSSDQPADSAPSDLNVTLIGDSIGINTAAYLRKYYPNLYADVKESRQFTDAKSIIQQLLNSGKLGPTVVIELGTNGSFSESQMRTVIDLIGSDRKIVFVNTQVPRSWCAGVNSTLSKVSAEYANTIIADWYSASVNNSRYFYKDGVHLNNTGLPVLAKVIADAISEAQKL